MEDLMQRMQDSARDGNVDSLFLILEENPFVLERIDEKPFVTTPLHTSVSQGKIHFAKEILNLKPSFARKRDHLGRTPLHLALEMKHLMEGANPRDLHLERTYQELITWLIKFDSELVRVKAKGMVTPLHHAAQINDEFNLADFLFVCPSSIVDLTVKCETAVHLAIRNNSFGAFKVLLGWLRRFNKEEILSWEDEDGNNAFHIATSTNQPEVMKLLIKRMAVNKKNGQGLTALDIYDGMDRPNIEIGQILLAAKAKRASPLHPILDPTVNQVTSVDSEISPKDTLVKYFSGDLSFEEKILKFMGFGGQIINKVPFEVRNVVLVVAVLIATATYQAALSPPGGYWQDDSDQLANFTLISYNKTNVTRDQHFAGTMILGSPVHIVFLFCNSVAFCLSLCTIVTATRGLCFSEFIDQPIILMAFAYFSAMVATLPKNYDNIQCTLFLVTIATALVPSCWMLFNQEWQLTKYSWWGKLRPGSLDQHYEM